MTFPGCSRDICDERHPGIYAELINSRQVVVGAWMRKAIRMLVSDMEDPRFVFDDSEYRKRIAFEERFCLQSKAPYYRQPIKLVPWEKAWWEAIYSFRMADTGKRRFTNAILEVARKNGKSSLLAADANFDLFCGPGGADICCASNDDKQAKVIWKEIAGMRSRLDPKRAVTGQNIVELTNLKRGITIFRMSAKSENKDGQNITKTLLDESHDIAEADGASELAEACGRAMSSQDEPLFINCTTQGFNRGCYLDKKIEYAKAVLDGEIDDIHLLPFLFEQDSEAEVWQDESTWEKSNPSLRYGIKKIDWLRAEVEKAKYDKATRIHLLTKDFNIPQASGQSWLMLADYSYPMPEFDLEQFRGSFVLGAVDLSATTDLSNAKALLMRSDDQTKYVLSHYWIPESKLTNSDDKEAGARYVDWAREGLLTICEGTEIDISQVADWFYQILKDHGLKPYVIGYDQRYSKVFTDRCEEYSFETRMLAQGRYLSNAMKLTEADLRARRINFQNNEMDAWCLGNTCCDVDNVGNIQPRKAPGQAARRIDGGVTLIMLEEMYRQYKSDFMKLIN